MDNEALGQIAGLILTDGENELTLIGLFAIGLHGILHQRIDGGGAESVNSELEGLLAGIHFAGLLHGELEGNLDANAAVLPLRLKHTAAAGALHSVIVGRSALMIGRVGLHCIIGIVILALVGVTGLPAIDPLTAVNMSALLAVIELIRSGGIILGAVGCVIGAGVPIGVKLAAICSGGSSVSFIAVLHGVAMTRLGNHHTAVVGNFRGGGSILEELAAGAPVVLLVAVSGAGSVHLVHLGQMVGMDMARCSLHHKSAFCAGLRCGFRCGRACRVRHYGIMVRRVAAADMGVAVGLLVSPLRSVEIMIVVGGPVRDPGKGIIAHVKQLAAEIALLISVPALLGAVRFLLREGGAGFVTTVYRHLAGGRFCSCRCGNDRFTGGYGGHLARGGINGSNSGLVRRPYHRVGRIGRRDRRFQAVIHCTGNQCQFALVKSDTRCRLRGGSDGDHSRLVREIILCNQKYGESVFVYRSDLDVFIQIKFGIAQSGAILDFDLSRQLKSVKFDVRITGRRVIRSREKAVLVAIRRI